MLKLRGVDEHYAEIKRMRKFISEYKVVKLEQFDRYLYNKEPRIKHIIRSHMMKKDMLYVSEGMCSTNADWRAGYDPGLIKALWVMLDFCEDAEYDSVAEYPSKLRFSRSGEIYDVCIAEQGKEQSLNVFCSKFITEPCRFLVIVEDKKQISKLTFEGIAAYCMVAEDGEVKYYRNEG